MFKVATAALLALMLSVAGPLLWSALFHANLRVGPGLPWSALAMSVVIGLTCWGLVKAAPTRRLLPAEGTRTWANVAAVAIAVCSIAAILLGLRLSGLSAADFASSIDMDALPISLRVARVLLTSVTAGFFEELGFRGFLQSSLEQRFGARVAIPLTALCFYAIHLGHGWTRGGVVTVLAVAVPFLFGGLLFGALAHRARSLEPCIVAHALVDLALLPREWAGTHNFTPLRIDGPSVLWTVALFGSLVLCLYWLGQLRNVTPAASSGRQR